jgi:TonB family protein
VISRTALPPLEVEVVAGDAHHTVQPGNNSVRVDLQPDSSSEQAADASTTAPAIDSTIASPAKGDAETSSGVTNAAERVQMSADTAEVVSRPVNPGYPLLARQMKVQGSVILRAFIGRDGLIQDLRVLSGPPILASAAEEAVKQWHFKPHYQGAEAVETQAKITVNFTISTN